jgi:hypothetical protein
MKEMILGDKCKPSQARGQRGRTAALLGGLVLASTLPGTCLKAQVLDVSKSVLLSWPEPTQEQIVVGADSLTTPLWIPWPEPVFKRFGELCMTVPTTASQQFFKLVPGRHFVDDFSDSSPPFTNRCPWMTYWKEAGDEIIVTNGVLRLNWHGPLSGGFLLLPLGTNVEAKVRNLYTSVDILDWVTSGTNWSVLGLTGRGVITGTNSGNGYIAGLSMNQDGRRGSVQPWIWNGSGYADGATFEMQQFPPPYRLQFSVWGAWLSLRVLSLTTGQLIQEVGATNATFFSGWVGLWINAPEGSLESHSITADNFFMSGTKP